MTFSRTLLIAAVLIALAVAGRFVPHASNFTPLIAVALVAGAYLGWRYALAIPLIAMVISDLFIGTYDFRIMAVVYGSFAVVGLSGLVVRRIGIASAPIASIIGSTLFFLTTNAAVWLFGTMYPHTLAGLSASYAAGLPFYRNMLAGDLLFTACLFGFAECAVYLAHRYDSARKRRLAAPAQSGILGI